VIDRAGAVFADQIGGNALRFAGIEIIHRENRGGDYAAIASWIR
jgi:hypothetical protein